MSKLQKSVVSCAAAFAGVCVAASASHAGVTVSTAAIATSFPGSPAIQTYADPNQPASASSRVPENFSGTRMVSQTFQVPGSDFKLGQVVITGVGAGGDSYSLHLYDLSGGSQLPGNYKPSTDGPNPGVDLLSGPTFTYNGSPNDHFIIFSFDSADNPTLISGHLYAFEIWPTANYATSGLNWIRGGGGISTYTPGRAYETNNGNGNTSPYNAATNFRTPLAGSDRDAVMAVYAVVPEPATIGLLGMAGVGMLARRRRN